MIIRRSIPIKVISVVVLCFFCWTFGGLFDIAYAVKYEIEQASKNKPKKEKPEEKFEKTLNDLEQALLDTETDTNTKKNKAKNNKSKIEDLDVEIKKQFADTEKKLKDEGLPQEILERHYNFVKHYEKNLKELQKNLDDIEKAKTKAEADDAIDNTKEFLKKVKPPKKHVPLDPNKLPHRSPEPKFIEPRTNSGQFKAEQTAWDISQQKQILVASAGSLKGLLNSELPDAYGQGTILLAQADPPTSADLAETIEVQFTSAIQAKALELEHNPVKIYNWVRNNIEFVPTYGSIQGADYCLQTKLCNAFDTSSLLIALLRASGIHARYVEGTIELPIEKVKNWVGGFTDSMEALRLLASAKIPTKGMTVGGEIKYARMEHVWVEAWIDYIPSRGARHKAGQGDTWIPLDASFKKYNYTQGIDIASEVPFDGQSFLDQIMASATVNEEEDSVTNVDSLLIEQTMQDYKLEIEDYIDQNYPNATVGDVIGLKEVIKQEFSYLLGTLPYKTIVKGSTYSNIPDNLRHKINFNVLKDMYDELIGTPINITKSLPELAGKKITLSYSHATPQDEAVINSYLPKPHEDGTPVDPNEWHTSFPAYLINIKPELRIDGIVVATGTSVGMGYGETFKMTFIAPKENPDLIINDVKAGEYLGIGLNLGSISNEQMISIQTKLETTAFNLETQSFIGLTKEDILGDMLYATALTYHTELDLINSIKTNDVIAITLPSETIFSTDLKVNSFFGFPLSVSSSGFSMDADRLIALVKALDGNIDKTRLFFFSSGMLSSFLEHIVPEQLLSTPSDPAYGISTIKALIIANAQGIPIYTVDQSNINIVLPQLQLDSGTITDIVNAVNAGKIVTVSKTDITFNDWTGCGYIISDPITGAAAYMISGGYSGAFIKALLTLVGCIAILPISIATTIEGEWALGVCIEEIKKSIVTISNFVGEIVEIGYHGFNVCIFITVVITLMSLILMAVKLGIIPAAALGLKAEKITRTSLILMLANIMGLGANLYDVLNPEHWCTIWNPD